MALTDTDFFHIPSNEPTHVANSKSATNIQFSAKSATGFLTTCRQESTLSYVSGDEAAMEEERKEILKHFGGKLICVDGGIAVGKTTFIDNLYSQLETRYGIQVNYLPEFVDMDMLKKFIEEPSTYACLFQEIQSNGRLRSLKEINKMMSKDCITIVDTGVMREIAFVNANYSLGNLSKDYKEAHMKTFEIVYNSLGKLDPQFTILLDASGARCKNNVILRNRGKECNYSLEYLETICKEYRNASDHPLIKGRTNVIKIDVNESFASDIPSILVKIIREMSTSSPPSLLDDSKMDLPLTPCSSFLYSI